MRSKRRLKPEKQPLPQQSSLLSFETNRLILSIPGPGGAVRVLDYLQRNRDFHDPWFPVREDSVFSIESQANLLAEELAEFETGRALPFWLALREQPDRIIGRFNLGHIIHGAFQSAIASYHLDTACIGQGLAAEAGTALIDVAFKTFGLHRIEANIRPENEASIALALRLGFDLEGFSPRYLQIGGNWADHLRFVRLADGPAKLENPEDHWASGTLVVRPLAWRDCQGYLDFEARNRDHLTLWSSPSCDGGMADQRRRYAQWMLEQQVGPRRILGVFPKDKPGQPVGLVDCLLYQPGSPDSCELRFAFDDTAIVQGLAHEALRLVMEDWFARRGLHKMTALCRAQSSGCLLILEQLGFEACGLDREALLTPDGWQDLLRYERFNPSGWTVPG
jgi:ribosomal-protein-alanine N-acetyltransferase